MRRKDIIDGFRIGIPIALGYFAVAFSLGIIAKQAGLTAIIGFVSSFFTRASAGEYGVYTLVAAQATYVEIVAGGEPAVYADECRPLPEDRTRHVVVSPSADGLLCD